MTVVGRWKSIGVWMSWQWRWGGIWMTVLRTQCRIGSTTPGTEWGSTDSARSLTWISGNSSRLKDSIVDWASEAEATSQDGISKLPPAHNVDGLSAEHRRDRVADAVLSLDFPYERISNVLTWEIKKPQDISISISSSFCTAHH